MKKIIIILSTLFIFYILATYIYLSTEPVNKEYCPITITGKAPIILSDQKYPDHKFKTINDASCLNETRVYDIVAVKTIDDIKKAVKIAKEKKLQISVAGVRHSMGGQSFFNDALILDMRQFNRIISLDKENKLLTVESGATWYQIQLYLHLKNLSVKSMQSTNIFTVGGSLSVNAHGMDHNAGSISSTIHSFTIMLADGSIHKVTRAHQPELFYAAIGGYGLFGIILEIELEITDNVMYQENIITVNYRNFPSTFEQIAKDPSYGLFYGHLSTSPLSFFEEMIIYAYKKIEYKDDFPPLSKMSLINFRRFLINLSKKRAYARTVKWLAEKYIDPAIQNHSNNKITSRNQVMYDSVEYLENILVNETDILQEYFIPRKNFVTYIDQMRLILQKSKIPVLNASVRIVNKESTALNYAPEDMFAIVLYLNQKVTRDALDEMENLTRDLIDLTLKLKGRFFLPYQLLYTEKQLVQSYPNIKEFFALKRKYDPELLFMNNFYAKYGN